MLEGGELTEVDNPRIDTPSFRDLQFVVTDGHSFAELERDSTVQQTVQTDPRSLSFEQINTDKSGRWRLEKRYVVDSSRSTVLVDVSLQSLTGRPYRLYVLADPSLDNDGTHDTGTCSGGALDTPTVTSRPSSPRNHDSIRHRAATRARPATAAASCSPGSGSSSRTAPPRTAT